MARLWGCHVIALARPPIPRIILLGLRRWGPHQKNTSKLEFRSLFTPNGPAKGAWGITPLPPKLGHRTASRKGGGGGGEGGEFVQNSSSGDFLPSGIYLNRRGSKMAMPLGSISIPPLLAPTLPRQPSTTPLAGRPWPLAKQKHAPRSNSGAFSGGEASAGFQLGYTFAGIMLAGNVFSFGMDTIEDLCLRVNRRPRLLGTRLGTPETRVNRSDRALCLHVNRRSRRQPASQPSARLGTLKYV